MIELMNFSTPSPSGHSHLYRSGGALTECPLRVWRGKGGEGGATTAATAAATAATAAAAAAGQWSFLYRDDGGPRRDRR